MGKKKVSTKTSGAVISLKGQGSRRSSTKSLSQKAKGGLKKGNTALKSKVKDRDECKKTKSRFQSQTSTAISPKKRTTPSNSKKRSTANHSNNLLVVQEDKCKKYGNNNGKVKSKVKNEDCGTLVAKESAKGKIKTHSKYFLTNASKNEKKTGNHISQNSGNKSSQNKKVINAAILSSNLKKRSYIEVKEEHLKMDEDVRQTRARATMANNTVIKSKFRNKELAKKKACPPKTQNSLKNKIANLHSGSQKSTTNENFDPKNNVKFKTPTKRSTSSQILCRTQTTQKNTRICGISTAKKAPCKALTEPKSKSKIERASVKIRKQDKQIRKAQGENECVQLGKKARNIESIEKDQNSVSKLEEENFFLKMNEDLERIILEAVKALKQRSLEDKVMDYLRQKYQRLDEIMIRSTIQELLNSGKLSQDIAVLKANIEEQEDSCLQSVAQTYLPILSPNIFTKDELDTQQQQSILNLNIIQCHEKLQNKVQSVGRGLVESKQFGKREEMVPEKGELKLRESTILGESANIKGSFTKLQPEEKSNEFIHHSNKDEEISTRNEFVVEVKEIIGSEPNKIENDSPKVSNIDACGAREILLKDLIRKVDDSLPQELKHNKHIVSKKESSDQGKQQESMDNEQSSRMCKSDTVAFLTFSEKEAYPDEFSNKEFSEQQRKAYDSLKSQQVIDFNERTKSILKIQESHYSTLEKHNSSENITEEAQDVEVFTSSTINQGLVSQFLYRDINTSGFLLKERIFEDNILIEPQKTVPESKNPTEIAIHEDSHCSQRYKTQEKLKSFSVVRTSQLKRVDTECQSHLLKFIPKPYVLKEELNEQPDLEQLKGKIEIVEEATLIDNQTKEQIIYDDSKKEITFEKSTNGGLNTQDHHARKNQIMEIEINKSIGNGSNDCSAQVQTRSIQIVSSKKGNASSRQPTYIETENKEEGSSSAKLELALKREGDQESHVTCKYHIDLLTSELQQRLKDDSISKVPAPIQNTIGETDLVGFRYSVGSAAVMDMVKDTDNNTAYYQKKQDASEVIINTRHDQPPNENTPKEIIGDSEKIEDHRVLSEDYEPEVAKKLKVSPKFENNNFLNELFNNSDKAQKDASHEIVKFPKVCNLHI